MHFHPRKIKIITARVPVEAERHVIGGSKMANFNVDFNSNFNFNFTPRGYREKCQIVLVLLPNHTLDIP